MSVWRTRTATPVRAEKRSDGMLGLQSPGLTGLFARFNGDYSNIDPERGLTALQSVAVGSACDLICSLISELPIDVFTGTGPDRTEKKTPSYLQDPGGDGYGVEDWICQVLISHLLRGNVFGDVIERGGNGAYPTTVQIWNPDWVSAYPGSDGSVEWSYLGQRVNNPADFVHRRTNVFPGLVMGLSPIAAKAAIIGLNVTGTQFGLQYFRDGALPSGILQNTETEMTKTVADTAKERFLAAVRGTREPVVLGQGWKFDAISINPEESQFLETQRFTGAECARIFGPGMAEILGYETGGSLTYVTVEGKSVHLLVYTLNKWMRRVERLLTMMLPRGTYAKLNRKALLETTTLDRYGAHQLALANRWMTVNEVRDTEDMPPVAWGDEPNDPITKGTEKIPHVD